MVGKVPKILVTGEHDERAPEGVEWVCVPVLRFERLTVAAPLIAEAVERPFGWIVFASPRAVTFWCETLLEHGVDLPIETQVACVGESTAAAAEEAGFSPDFYPTEPGSEAFLVEFEDLLSNTLEKPRVLIPQAEGGRPAIALRLKELGCDVTEVPLYKSIPRDDLGGLDRLGDLSGLIFTSPSSAEALLARFTPPAGVQWIAIGQYTRDFLAGRGAKDVRLLPGGEFSRVREVL